MEQIKTFELAEQVKSLSIVELRHVLNMHGGSYDWCVYDVKGEVVAYKDRPIIHYESGFTEDAMNVYVNGVYINEKGIIVVDMEDKYENNISCAVYDLEPCHIRYISEYMDNSKIETPEYTERVNALIDKFMEDLGQINKELL